MKKVAKDRFRWKADDIGINPVNLYLESELPNPRIYAKIDYLTVMFKDTSIDELLDFLGLTIFTDEFVRNMFERTVIQADCISFTYNSIHFDVKKIHLYGMDINTDVFGITFPEIRLDISGNGLDFLRHNGLNVDEYFRDQANYPGTFHLTRFDIAFDFVNYKPQLLDEMIDHCLNWHTDSDRICIYKKPSGLVYSVKLGREKTLYLGTGNKMLRAYDKKKEYTDARTGAYTKDDPYDKPESWIRLELQTRREKASECCFGHVGTLSLLKKIYEDYCFADVFNTTENNRKPAAFWQNIFDWEKIPQIIQNFEKVDIVEYKDRVVERTFEEGGFILTILSLSILGKKEFQKQVKILLDKLNNPKTEAERRLQKKFLLQCDLCDVNFNDILSPFVNGNPFGNVLDIALNINGLRPIDLEEISITREY